MADKVQKGPLSQKADLRYIPLDTLMPLVRESLAAGQDVRFYPRGVSMLPMLRQGVDSVVLSSVKGSLTRHDIPLYQRDNGSYVLHRIVRAERTVTAEAPVYTCCGDHQFALEPGIRHDQVIAVVSGFYRADHFVPITHPRYRLYCAVLQNTRSLRHFRWKCIGFARRIKRRLVGSQK